MEFCNNYPTSVGCFDVLKSMFCFLKEDQILSDDDVAKMPIKIKNIDKEDLHKVKFLGGQALELTKSETYCIKSLPQNPDKK